jgi:MFS transporter, ACS family, tartrate transporter
LSQTATFAAAVGAKSEIETSTIRAISWRLIPFLVLAYFFSYLDRVNLGFAALTMNAELKFTPLIFAWGAGIFFIGYSSSRCRATWRWKDLVPAAGSRASW